MALKKECRLTSAKLLGKFKGITRKEGGSDPGYAVKSDSWDFHELSLTSQKGGSQLNSQKIGRVSFLFGHWGGKVSCLQKNVRCRRAEGIIVISLQVG